MSDDTPTAEQAAADPTFKSGTVRITSHGPACSDGIDKDAARPPKITGKDR